MVMTAVPPYIQGVTGAGHMEAVRRGNLALVLGRIAETSPAGRRSRAQISALTGLTKASVSSLVLDLISSGLVTEVGLNQQSRGRPGVELELNPNKAVLGAEINVDYLAVGVVSLAGTLLMHEVRERDNRSDGVERVMAALSQQCAVTAVAAEKKGIDVLGGGLAVPGLIDAAGQVVVSAPNLGWKNARPDLRVLLPGSPLGVVLCNEANAAALAEMDHQSDTDFMFVSGEVGVGGGLVVGRELFTGADGHAGEVGHVVVDPYGSDCLCGGRGCLETVAGQDAIADAAGLTGHPARSSRSLTLSVLLGLLKEGDARALSAVERAGFCLGLALASSARIVPFTLVVLGGHLAVLDPWLRISLMDSLQRYSAGRFPSGNVLVSALGSTGALLGAAGLALRSVLEAPHTLRR